MVTLKWPSSLSLSRLFHHYPPTLNIPRNLHTKYIISIYNWSIVRLGKRGINVLQGIKEGRENMAVKKLLTLLCILALAMLACGVTVDLGTSSPTSTPTSSLSSSDQVSTSVAQTLQALTQEAVLATPANTSTPTATATVTNMPDPPTLSVSVSTDCYAGPSTHYGFVITIYPGTTVTVTGKDPGDNYWIIDVPGYPGTLCWLSGQYASVSGDTTDLSAPATTTILYALSEPDHLRISCNRPAPPPTPDPAHHGRITREAVEGE